MILGLIYVILMRINALEGEIMNFPDHTGLQHIKNLYGSEAFDKSVQLAYSSKTLFQKTKELVNGDRIGEVVFAVQRPNGKWICVRSKEYPEGVFRIPTGGIKHGEDILEAVKREVHEELGLTAEIVKFIGTYTILFTHENDQVPFYSFLFHLKELSGRLLEDATDDEVCEVTEADCERLCALSQKLLTLENPWSDWGLFRNLTTSAIYDYMIINQKVTK